MRVLSLITALGALQGALLLLFIGFRERHPKTTPLALLLLVFSARLATIPTWNATTLIDKPWIYPLTAPLPFLFGFLLWWYAEEISRDESARPRRLPLHFIPWFAETAAVTYTVLKSNPEEYRLLINSIFAGDPPLWLPVRNALKVTVNLVYIILTARIAFGKKASRYSPERRIRLRSIVIIPTLVLLFFAYVAVVPGATENLSDGSPEPFLFLAGAMALLIYTISFLQLAAPDIPGHRVDKPTQAKDALCPPEECLRLMRRLDEHFDSGAFRDPDLTLKDLASRLNVNANRLSYAVNRTAGISFRCLLNRRRLADFLKQAEEAKKRRCSFLDMAFNAGFPSKSTFNRVFREEYGMTPSAYLAEQNPKKDSPTEIQEDSRPV